MDARFLVKGYKKAIDHNAVNIISVKADVSQLEANFYSFPDKMHKLFANIWVETVLKSVIVAVLVAGVIGGYQLIIK